MIPSPGHDSTAAEFRLLDVTVRVQVPSERAELLDPYPPRQLDLGEPDLRIVLERPEAPDGLWTVVGDTRSGCSDALLAGELLSAVNIGVLERTRHLAMHSGVVGLGAGAIALPGPTGAGKSTLTAACVHRGFSYVSDEALCVDRETGLVQPFLRPLALSSESLELIDLCPPAGPAHEQSAERILRAGELGGFEADGPLRLTHVVLATRQTGTPTLDPIPRREAVTSLLTRAFNHYRWPGSAFDVVYRVVAASQVWRLAYSRPLDAAELLRDRFSEEP